MTISAQLCFVFLVSAILGIALDVVANDHRFHRHERGIVFASRFFFGFALAFLLCAVLADFVRVGSTP